MKKHTKTPEQERLDAHDLRKSFLIDSIDQFTDENDIYETIRTLSKLRNEWKPGPNEHQDSIQKMVSNIQGLESFLLDIAEADARANILFLASYEQAPE